MPAQPIPASRPKRGQTWMPLLALILATTALYGQFLWNPIVFDDLLFFRIEPGGSQQASSYRYSPFELRSLPYASLAWSYRLLGQEVFHFRIENLLLHLAVVLTLFFFLRNLFAAVADGQDKVESGYRHQIFFSALLFALNPVSTYAAGYLIQRTILMATLFSLLAMLLWVHGSARGKTAWLWLSVPLYYLAAFSKEHAIMLPSALLALTMLLHADWRGQLKRNWGIFAALAGIACLVILSKKGILGSVYEESAAPMLTHVDSGLAYPLSILTQSWLFFKYAALWAFPNPAWMSIDMREPFAQSLLSPYLLALAGFMAWGIAALRLLLKRGVAGIAGFALLFPWLMFFTEFSAVRIQEEFVLYRSYLWAAGAFCLLPVLLARFNARLAILGLSAAALTLFPMSMDRLATFSHPLLLWDDAEKLVRDHLDRPGVSRIYYNRGTEYSAAGKYDLGIADFKKAIALVPGHGDAYGNMGRTYLAMGDLPDALAAFDTAIDIYRHTTLPQNPRFIYGRALTLERMGKTQKALDDFRLSCQLARFGCEKLGSARVQERPAKDAINNR